MNRVGLVLIVGVFATSCGDESTPSVRDFEPAGAGGEAPVGRDEGPASVGTAAWSSIDLYGDSGVKLDEDTCWSWQDCEEGEGCFHAAYFLDRAGTPGVCEVRPSTQYVQLHAVSPIGFAGPAAPDPVTDDFIVEEGVFGGEFMADQDGSTIGLEFHAFPLPYTSGVGFGFNWQVGLYIRIVDPADLASEIECRLAFLRSGEVLGGVLREPGKLLCSTDNWQSPEATDAAGLLIEYSLCDEPGCP